MPQRVFNVATRVCDSPSEWVVGSLLPLCFKRYCLICPPRGFRDLPCSLGPSVRNMFLPSSPRVSQSQSKICIHTTTRPQPTWQLVIITNIIISITLTSLFPIRGKVTHMRWIIHYTQVNIRCLLSSFGAASFINSNINSLLPSQHAINFSVQMSITLCINIFNPSLCIEVGAIRHLYSMS